MQKWGNKHPRPAEQALESTPDPRIKQGFHKKWRGLRGASDEGTWKHPPGLTLSGEIMRTDVKSCGSELR